MLTIRPCRDGDIAVLQAHIPTPGHPERHRTRFDRQRCGESTFLIVWIDGTPVGAGEILWGGCHAPEVRLRYADCPELSGLDVWPPERRSQGIGTALIRAAEGLVRERGHDRIGLGVEDGNPRAAALYLRLGYRETGCHYLDRHQYVDDDGVRRAAADPARFLVKDLTPRTG